MPQFDKTGPKGAGPGTGRGMGACGGGKGIGRGCGMGLRRRFNALDETEKKEFLQNEIEGLKQELEMAEEELKEMKG